MAGLIDGEGCLDMQGSINKRDNVYYCRPRLRITLSGPAGEMMIPQFMVNFGGCLDHKDRKFENPDWLPAYTWCLSGKTHLRKLLQNIVNHLIIKKEQARFCIWWLDNVGGKKQVTQEVRRFGTGELKAMKKDPQRLSEAAVRRIKDTGFYSWSEYSDSCLLCKRFDVKHEAKGYCKTCYDKIRGEEKKH